MIYPSIDKLLNIVNSKYELVHIAARRSKQIAKEGYLQMPESSTNVKRILGELSRRFLKALSRLKKEENNPSFFMVYWI